jgi:hypothetical protein
VETTRAAVIAAKITVFIISSFDILQKRTRNNSNQKFLTKEAIRQIGLFHGLIAIRISADIAPSSWLRRIMARCAVMNAPPVCQMNKGMIAPW